MYTSMPGPAAEAGVGAAVQRARRRRFRLGLCRWRQELQRLGQRLYRRWELCLGGSTLKHLTAAAARAMEAVWWELLVGAALHNIKYDKGPEARTLDTLLKISDLGPLAGGFLNWRHLWAMRRCPEHSSTVHYRSRAYSPARD